MRAVVVLGLVHMSLQHVRQEALLGAIVPLIVAEPLCRALGATAPKPASWRLPAAQTALGGALLALAVGARLLVPEVRVDGPTAPISALAQVQPALRRTPVLNAYDFGGYLIFEGVRPYVDGRADMYGDAFVKRYTAVNNGEQPALDQALKQYGIAWTITQPHEGIVAALKARPDWTQIYRDKYAVVMARKDALAAQPLIPAKAGTQISKRWR